MQSKTNFLIRLGILIFFTVLGVSTAAGKIIYVDDDAPAAGGGTSWTDAFCCLQDALAETGIGDEIRVAQGVYKPDRRVQVMGGRIGAQVTASGDWTATFELIEGITMKGGYAGHGNNDPNMRDIRRYETVLSGDLYGDDMDVNNSEDIWEATTRAENSYHVVTGRNGIENAVAVLDGFTITGGSANEPSDYNGNGGGLYNPQCTIRIANCTFTRNFASLGGGGIYNYAGELNLTNCAFNENLADPGDGGGIGSHFGELNLTNCTFTGNRLGTGSGGGIDGYMCDMNLTNCTFIGNSSWINSGEGGGIAIKRKRNYQYLTNCTFFENSARAGGGIYNEYGGPILTNCVFRGNSVRDQGGGMCNILKSTSGESPIFRNCLFTGNHSGFRGGGIYNLSCEPVLTNCTFAGNWAGEGNALYCKSDYEQNTITLTNCILWDFGNEIHSTDLSIVNIFYSNIHGGWSGEGNIDEYPQFADPNGPDYKPGTEDDDLRLTPLSPCIDTGDPNYVSESNETDVDGNPRIIGDRVDMGAYEFQYIIYVDDDASGDPRPGDILVSDPRENGAESHPMDSIQEAIDIAKDGQTVLVRPGVYPNIDFMGKAITVAGTEGAAMIGSFDIDRTGSIVKQDTVTFHTGEGPDSVLKNFIVKNSRTAILLNYGSSPTITNLTIVDNDFGISAYENSNPDISNCIFFNNKDGDLFQCEARFSCFEIETPGSGNIVGNPLFVDPANSDYHLMSEGYRWNMQNGSWTWDSATSRCIDAGDPTSPLGDEPTIISHDENNEHRLNPRINMGAYGGTYQASLAPLYWFPEYETDPPEPNPAQWARDGKPREDTLLGANRITEYWIKMIAVEATDANGPVEYFFECTTDASLSSDWQRVRNYEVRVESAGQGHRFRVKARDQFGNETEWSEELSVE